MFNKRIIFMGTPEIATKYLASLVENDFNVVATYTQPPRKKNRGMVTQRSPVHLLSIKKNIPVFSPINFFSQEVVANFIKLNPDLVVVMGYGMLLPSKILSIPTYGCLNIHVSLLPRWRGASPIEHAILNGDKKTGVTIIKLEKKLDAGPIIASKEIKIEKKINKDDLTLHLNIIGIKLLIAILPKLFDKKILLKKQNEKKITYARKITTEFRKIDFYKNVETVSNHIRAFSAKPSAWFMYNNNRINIIKCSHVVCDAQPSTIINNKFHIGCKNGKIIPEVLQREGRKSLLITEFVKGFTFELGKKVNE